MTTTSAARSLSSRGAMPSFCTQACVAWQASQPKQGCRSCSRRRTISTLCPASRAPFMNDSHRSSELPPLRGLAEMMRMFFIFSSRRVCAAACLEPLRWLCAGRARRGGIRRCSLSRKSAHGKGAEARRTGMPEAAGKDCPCLLRYGRAAFRLPSLEKSAFLSRADTLIFLPETLAGSIRRRCFSGWRRLSAAAFFALFRAKAAVISGAGRSVRGTYGPFQRQISCGIPREGSCPSSPCREKRNKGPVRLSLGDRRTGPRKSFF